METQIDQEVIDTVCNSLRASKQSLRHQLMLLGDEVSKNKREIVQAQLADVEQALEIFQHMES